MKRSDHMVYVKVKNKYVPVNKTNGLYRKLNGEYMPICYDAQAWFPTDGIWLVQVQPGRASQQCVLKIGELPTLYPYIRLARYRDLIAGVIVETRKEPLSAVEIADRILKEIAKQERPST